MCVADTETQPAAAPATNQSTRGKPEARLTEKQQLSDSRRGIHSWAALSQPPTELSFGWVRPLCFAYGLFSCAGLAPKGCAYLNTHPDALCTNAHANARDSAHSYAYGCPRTRHRVPSQSPVPTAVVPPLPRGGCHADLKLNPLPT